MSNGPSGRGRLTGPDAREGRVSGGTRSVLSVEGECRAVFDMLVGITEAALRGRDV